LQTYPFKLISQKWYDQDLHNEVKLKIICHMPIRVIHILDEKTSEDDIRLLSILLNRMPSDLVEQSVLVIGRKSALLVIPPGIEKFQISRRFNWTLRIYTDFECILKKFRPDVVHTCNADIAVVGASRGRAPVAVTISDPAQVDDALSVWQQTVLVNRNVNIICTSRTIQRKVVEAGVPTETTSMIRPGVDFSAIQQAGESVSRKQLGLPAKGKVFLTTSPPTRKGGQYSAVWAMAILHYIWPDACLLIPGLSKEQRRIMRLISNIYCPEIYLPTEYRYSPAELLAVSDMLLVPALSDINTGWLAWALAAGVPIVGSEVPSVAEMITDQHNGFLCKPSEPHTLAIRIRTAAESGELLKKCIQNARNQAYEMFPAERCIDEYFKVFENLAAAQKV